MSYVVPSTLVYQQLASNSGVANVTPDLDSCIIGPVYNVVSYTAGSQSSLITSAAVTSAGASASISNNAITNTVYLGSTKVGQIVDANSVSVYLNSSKVETKVVQCSGTIGSNVVSVATFTGVGSIVVGASVLTSVSNVTNLREGDVITIAGVGPSGANLTTTILSISGGSVTISDTASVLGSGAAITRSGFNNTISATSTLRMEAGDQVVLSFSSATLTTTVLSVTTVAGVVTGFTTTDVMPSTMTTPFFLSVRKSFNNLLLPVSYGGHTNYSLASVTIDGSVVINPLPVTAYGTVISGTVHIPYTALRTDLCGSLMEIASPDDQVGTLGIASDKNPLALGVQIALANTVGRIMCVAIPSNDLAGYLSALDLIESQRVYAVVPLTQDVSILSAVKNHVEQLSTPEAASWRIALINTAIPTVTYIGPYNPSLVNANSGNNAVTLVSSSYVLAASNAQFITDGVVPGDVIKVTSHNVTTQVVTSMTVLSVISNQQVVVNSPIALAGVNYYVQRTLSKSQQAAAVAAMSSSFTSSRVFHIQSDQAGVVVDGVTKYLPGYYLACAEAGLVSGLPAQQSLTNIGVAGISNLGHSNRYFTRAQLNTMASVGTWLMVQEGDGTVPYSRHSLSTDMSVLQYREIQQVKNIDYLSYFFHDILKAFPGKYNITPDTLQTLRTTIIAGAKLLQGKKLPKIGAPLIDYSIKTLKQDDVNKDTIIVEMTVQMPTVANYINLYLIY